MRIAFDPVALELASSRAPLLGEVEDRLLAARGPDQVGGALAWVDERVSDALHAGATIPLDHVTIVSLRQLGRSVAPYRQGWAELPESLRHPGALRRVHGFVIDADGQDVLLVGTSDGPGEPLDIDDLSQAVRAVWRDGLTPICSLDPEPWNMAGPQRAVIAGVTRSSHFARVMLDADYQLKKVLFGETHAEIAGFQSLKEAAQAWAAKPEAAERPLSFTTRFWFTSVPPGEGDIRLSPDGRMALFDARVQVLTENMLNRGNVLVNAGTQHPMVVGATRGFTLNFSGFQQQMPIFRQLQSLFDLALAATLLKRQGAPPAVLEELAALPIRPAAVPDTYAGLTVAAGQRGLHVMYLQGGVQMTTPIGSRAAIRVNDPRSERFRERATVASGVSREVDRAGLRLVSCTGTPTMYAEAGPTKPGAAGADLEALDEMIDADPENGEYRKQRARAYCRRRLYYLAEQELRTAARFLPDDPALALLGLQLRLERDDKLDVAELPPDQVQALADFYLIESVGRHGAGDAGAALTAIDWALKLRPGRMDLVFHRANILLASRSPTEAIAFLTESVRQSPRDARLQLARAQANFRCQHWTDAIADATRAVELEPGLAHAYLVRAVTLLSLAPPDTRRAYSDLRRIQELDPQNPGALVVRANLLRLEGDRDGATAAINRALRLTPMMPEARTVRALIDAEATLPDLEPASSRALRDQPAALQMLEDLNIVLVSQPTNWQMRVLRSQLLVAYFNRLNDTELDWQTILPKLATVIDATPHGRKRFAAAQAPTTVEEAVKFRQVFAAALADAIADELESARTSAPEEVRPKLLEQESLLRARAEHPSEEQKP